MQVDNPKTHFHTVQFSVVHQQNNPKVLAIDLSTKLRLWVAMFVLNAVSSVYAPFQLNHVRIAPNGILTYFTYYTLTPEKIDTLWAPLRVQLDFMLNFG